MLLVVFTFLATLSVALIGITGLLLWLQVWLLVIIRLCEGHFIRAGGWLCLALVPFSVIAGESFTPLYIAIMVAAVSAAIWKLVRRYRKAEKAESVLLEDTSAEHGQEEVAFTLKQNKNGTWVLE